MAILLLLMMLTACAASPRDLSPSMMTFPEETKTAHVKLTPSVKTMNAVTVCLRSFTDVSRNHVIFSLATPSHTNGFLIFNAAINVIEVNVAHTRVLFKGQDYTLNAWHSMCCTWDKDSGLTQLWLDGKPTVRRFVGGPQLNAPSIILGQEQDSLGGKFDASQSFVGMISDVHMWDYTLSPCEIKRYVTDLNFTPGNVLNWRALEFQIVGRVLIEEKQTTCFN